MRYLGRQQVSGVAGVHAIDHYSCRNCNSPETVLLDSNAEPPVALDISHVMAKLDSDDRMTAREMMQEADGLQKRSDAVALANLKTRIRATDFPEMLKTFLLELAS